MDGDSRLVVHGHCNDGGRVRVTEEDSGEVVLRLEVEGRRKGGCLACPTVALAEPLGDCRVVDGRDGESVLLDPDGC
ncbi:MAG: hypothetical protein ABIP03_15755 [Aquihabitans sp.]